ncbi:uL15 family ribosomal protein [Candidatus Woesearchaeota archaeon]|nr:uL15 family ribosomal protein [Candidatus Woesearchaeota archaeon]
MIIKRKKITRYRGSHTHGGGAKKKRRGAGNRGGRGMAGSGKRADQKKPTILKLYGNTYFGKKGFNSVNKKKIKTINIETIESRLYNWLKKGVLKKEKDTINIDLKKMGYDKLLGSGKINNKLNIEVRYASKKAIEKIEKSGGKINVLNTKHN